MANNFLSGLTNLLTSVLGTQVHEFSKGGDTRSYTQGGIFGRQPLISPVVEDYTTQANASPPEAGVLKPPQPQASQAVPAPPQSPAQTAPQTQGSFSGFRGRQAPPDLEELVLAAAEEYGVDPRVIMAMLAQESGGVGYDPGARNISQDDPTSIDRGVSQINTLAFPDVTDEQADDPRFAIPFLARKLAGDTEALGGNLGQGIAAYNVGRGGVADNLRDEFPFGGGEKGQTYLDNVARNLGMELLQELGLSDSLSPSLVGEYTQ